MIPRESYLLAPSFRIRCGASASAIPRHRAAHFFAGEKFG